MRKKIAIGMIMILLLSLMMGSTALADTGPKPTVTINFQGIEDTQYYVTLLLQDKYKGDWSNNDEYSEWYGDETAWKVFRDYKGTGGCYFNNYYEDCTESNTFSWMHWPMEHYKILIYIPEENKCITDDKVYEQYAFHSVYTVTMGQTNDASAKETEIISIQQAYDHTGEISAAFLRLAVTLAIELTWALIFRYRRKCQLTIIALTNIVTQMFLNVILGFINYKDGIVAAMVTYLWLEIIIFVTEALIYQLTLGKEDEKTKKRLHPWLYAFLANTTSFLVGIIKLW